ncbi:MAG TPA: hypothetical protein VG125_07950 [Pirellulales bacterium]|jgi:hypothetical protein|nr:hypothetical protein [Pirellulales bacterium]
MIDESDDDIERVLAGAAPRKAPPQLRAIVVAAVAAELAARSNHKPRWQSWVGRAVAASVLFSIATFVGVTSFEARRMARWDERRVVRADVVELTAAIASVTDDESARAVERYLISRLPMRARPALGTRRDLQEIEHWAAGEVIAERSQSDDKTQERI